MARVEIDLDKNVITCRACAVFGTKLTNPCSGCGCLFRKVSYVRDGQRVRTIDLPPDLVLAYKEITLDLYKRMTVDILWKVELSNLIRAAYGREMIDKLRLKFFESRGIKL